MVEARVFQLAAQAGIKIDAFGCPVCDKKSMLVEFAKLIEKELKNESN